MLKSEERASRTKESLLDALVELAEGTSINRITVTQLSRKANINRITFYRHFDGMSDFLNRLIDEVIESLQIPPTSEVFRSRQGAITYYTLFFDSVKRHDSFFVMMLGNNGLPDFRTRFLSTRRRWHESVVMMNRNEFNPIINNKLLAVTFVANLLSLIEYWLTEDRERNSGYMAEQLIALTYDRVLVNYGKSRKI